MILSEKEIFDKIKSPVNKDKIIKCIGIEKDCKIYIDGNGYVNPITNDFIDTWETEAKKDLKKHLEICPTISISKLIRDELNKGIKTDKAIITTEPVNENLVDEYLSHIWKNNDLDYFIDTFLKKAIDTDFESFLVVTKGKRIVEDGKVYEEREGIKILNDKDFNPYIIYISIADVHDFMSGGKTVEYFIYKFKNEEKKTVYRVIDSEKDLLVTEDAGEYTIDDTSIFYHGAGYCPVKQISDLYLYSSNTAELKASQFSHVIGDLMSFFIQYKIWKTSEVLHAYPKYWSYGFKCPVCDGRKDMLNPDNNPERSALYMYHDPSKKNGETIRCPYCKGEGSIATINSKQVLKIPATIGDNTFSFSGAPAGFVQFPTESLEYQAAKLDDLEAKIIYNATGNKNIVAERLQTATEVITNVRGLQERINERQSTIETNVDFVVNTIIKMLKKKEVFTYTFPKNLSYKDEDILYEEVKKAVEANMPKEYIDEIKKELTKSRFTNQDIINSINEQIIKEDEETRGSEDVPGKGGPGGQD